MAYVLAKKGMFDISSIQTLGTDGKTVIDSKAVYTLMITQLVPKGLVGVLAAALLSGLMSQISGALNSIATLFSYDLYKRFKPEAGDQQLVRIGRISIGMKVFSAASMTSLPI
jgi:SSS family solute:Na+ symporter